MGILRKALIQFNAMTTHRSIVFRRLFTVGYLVSFLAFSGRAIAQVTADNTTSTIVTGNGVFSIDGGGRSGGNLFHSFSQFSIPTGKQAIFNNAADVQNIFSRVTGGTASSIDGLIQTQGMANLFLLNPQGILFGPNAQLNLGGSFLGTTATHIKFADGTTFSSLGPVAPILTLSVPIGLQMGEAAAIQVQGTGHRLGGDFPVILPYVPYAPYQGLQVQPSQTLALIGGDIDLTGGVLQAPGGRIELGSVAQGEVSLQGIASGFAAGYVGITQFGTVHLGQQSSLEVGAVKSGTIQVQAGQVNLQEGSVISGMNFGAETAGTIRILATQGLTVDGTAPDLAVQSTIIQDNFGSGTGGELAIVTPNLLVQAGAGIFSRNYGSGPGGKLSLNAEAIKINGYAEINPAVTSQIQTIATSTGKGGTLIASTQSLELSQGGSLGSYTALTGLEGGDVIVNADTINVQGGSSANTPSALGSFNFAQSGQSGDVTINTNTLAVLDTAQVGTSSLGNGNAGTLRIQADKSILVSGYGNDNTYVTSISSDVTPATLIFQQLFGLPDMPSGASGDVMISTPSLTINQGGEVSVSNFGLGDAGKLRINADRILLNNDGMIDAITTVGNGGNIEIQSKQIVLMDNSHIVANAFGQDNLGNGGNISIDASIILSVNNSDIVANASKGRGGNIHITSQGIVGLKNRDRVTPESDITASSEFGIDGNVNITTPGIQPDSGVVVLPVNLLDSSQKIARDCKTSSETSRFIMTGRGGIPGNPGDRLNVEPPWSDLRAAKELEAVSHRGSRSAAAVTHWVEATGWRHDSDRQVTLVASSTAEVGHHPASCAKYSLYPDRGELIRLNRLPPRG